MDVRVDLVGVDRMKVDLVCTHFRDISLLLSE